MKRAVEFEKVLGLWVIVFYILAVGSTYAKAEKSTLGGKAVVLCQQEYMYEYFEFDDITEIKLYNQFSVAESVVLDGKIFLEDYMHCNVNHPASYPLCRLVIQKIKEVEKEAKAKREELLKTKQCKLFFDGYDEDEDSKESQEAYKKEKANYAKYKNEIENDD